MALKLSWDLLIEIALCQNNKAQRIFSQFLLTFSSSFYLAKKEQELSTHHALCPIDRGMLESVLIFTFWVNLFTDSVTRKEKIV